MEGAIVKRMFFLGLISIILVSCEYKVGINGTYVGNFEKLKDTIKIVDSSYTRTVYNEYNKLIFKQSGKADYSRKHNNVCFYGLNYVVKNSNEQLSNVDKSGSITMAKEGFLTIRLRNSDDIYYEKIK
ncbi:hypothetical protein [Chryseobacterium defluvii]|nr:hypothetical protein [Chryseobacterium defluvii]